MFTSNPFCRKSHMYLLIRTRLEKGVFWVGNNWFHKRTGDIRKLFQLGWWGSQIKKKHTIIQNGWSFPDFFVWTFWTDRRYSVPGVKWKVWTSMKQFRIGSAHLFVLFRSICHHVPSASTFPDDTIGPFLQKKEATAKTRGQANCFLRFQKQCSRRVGALRVGVLRRDSRTARSPTKAAATRRDKARILSARSLPSRFNPSLNFDPPYLLHHFWRHCTAKHLRNWPPPPPRFRSLALHSFEFVCLRQTISFDIMIRWVFLFHYCLDSESFWSWFCSVPKILVNK